MLRYFLFSSFLIVLGNFAIAQQSNLEKAKLAFEANDFEKSIQLTKQFLKDHPSHIQATELLGTSYASLEKWEKSAEVYKELVTKYPSQADYHFKYGGSLGLQAKNASKIKALLLLDDVKFHLKHATILDEKHVEARWALVQLYMELPGIIGGSASTAKAYAEELKNISPVDGALAFGYIEEYQENWKSAEAFYKEAVQLGNSTTCYQKLVDIQLKQNKKKEAIATLKKAYAVTSDRKFSDQLDDLIN